MKRVKRIVVAIITVVLIFGMLAGNITFVFAQSSDLSVMIDDLEKLYNEKKEIKRGTYTHYSWAYFQDALQHAKQVLDHRDEADEEIVDWAYEYLATAPAFLEEHDGSSVDLSALENAYNTYKNVKQENYNDVSWKHFTDALEEARKMLYEYEYILQIDVDRTLNSLETAYERLEEGEPDFTKLEETYNQYKDLEQGDYNLGSWSMFEQALRWIETLLTDPYERESATQWRIDYELEDFLMTVERLETGEPDLTELEQLFHQFKEEYKDINPEELLSSQDDIELFETIMYHVPLYLSDYREYATHYETEELILDIIDLKTKLTNSSVDEENSKEEEEDNPTQEGNDDSNEEDKITQDGNNGHGSKDELTSIQTDSKEEDDNTTKPSLQNKGNGNSDTNNNISKNLVTDKTDLDNNPSALNKNIQDSPLGQLLPNTSTNHYNMMVLGLIIIVEGIFLYLYFNFISFLRRRFNLF